MLRYLGRGERHFGAKPLSPSVRINWEFYAVLDGRCAPWFPGAAKPTALHARRLWVFPPECAHGWVGERRACRVVVFHFSAVPAVLAQQVRRRGWLERPLGAAQRRRLAQLADELAPHAENPTELSPLHAQKAVAELALLALAGDTAARLPTLASGPQQKTETALEYFRAHLEERPTIAAAARAAGVSASHLRRLFATARRESPRQAFRRVAIEHAMELLSQTDLTLEAVAERCGFAGASEFSRAFKRECSVPPAVWRRGLLPAYAKPVRTGRGLRRTTDQHRVVKTLRRYGAHG